MISYLFGAVLLAVAVFSPDTAFAHYEDLDELMRMVHTPDELARFYSRDFETRQVIPISSQPQREFLRTKSGNCEDFAILSQDVLGRLGIKSEIVYMKFRGLQIGHAVCMWKEGSYYSFFDNRKLIRTNMTSLEGVLRTYYPDIECCTGCERGFDVGYNVCM